MLASIDLRGNEGLLMKACGCSVIIGTSSNIERWVRCRTSGVLARGETNMRIAQIAPLMESVPPKLYGATERIVSYLTEELVKLGHDVT